VASSRTIGFSDAHGYPELIHNALAHSGFRAGEDVLVAEGGTVRIEEGDLAS
jgi:hypothetical protein